MLFSHNLTDIIEAGCDEAGRGCLAGPVFAAAVILPSDFTHPMINDSKQLSAKQREMLRIVIEKEALAYGVASVSPEEIDEINILKASLLAMHRALDLLKIRPEHIIVDGNRFSEYIDPATKKSIPHACFIKGDARFFSIAAASILAKTYRDEYMRDAARQYPQYGWERNFGYPTKEHREAIKKYGITPLHRKTFQLLPDSKLV